MMHPLNLAAAFLAAILLGSLWQLDEPRETDVMELMVIDKAEAESSKAFQP